MIEKPCQCGKRLGVECGNCRTHGLVFFGPKLRMLKEALKTGKGKRTLIKTNKSWSHIPWD